MTDRVTPSDAETTRAADAVRALGGPQPDIAIILGSGLGDAVRDMEVDAELPYSDVPGFPPPSVPGHTGRLLLGRCSGIPAVAFRGRIHFYEGHPMRVVTLPARLAASLGARVLIATAAVGGLDPKLRPGSLVVGTDHLNFMGENPLRGWTDDQGRPPFVDLTRVYDPEIVELAMSSADELGLEPRTGVYAAMSGPSYETPAEIEFLRRSGATVVGMSVVPEALTAAALGMRFAGLFCVTNLVDDSGVDHADVTATAGRFAATLGDLLMAILPKL